MNSGIKKTLLESEVPGNTVERITICVFSSWFLKIYEKRSIKCNKIHKDIEELIVFLSQESFGTFFLFSLSILAF